MTTETTMNTPTTPKPGAPWWREPMMWLVIGGPATVVVAAIVTAGIAIRHGDVPLNTSAKPEADALTPATQARNHAATARP
jgi:hypothetical protein